MAHIVRSIVLIITTLFPIVNPIGTAPLFLGLTQSGTPEDRRILSRKIATNSFFLLLCSILIGTHVLSFFGISLPIVQVGGGLVVISAGWVMLKSDDDGHDQDRREMDQRASENVLQRKAFYPLTLPLTVGPGAIATAITLGANIPRSDASALLFAALEAAVGSLVMALLVWVCFAFADRTAKLLGPTAMSVMTRLSAFLLTCIGLQIVWNGVRALVREL
ncbi:MAG TPA: MarC family protein [Terracidiphilus sp.]|nr:MarC family protein [Terracidiphilus sp.]